jgi:hypothetical protein
VSHPLTSAFLKVERARKHLTELDQEIRAFVKVDPYRLSFEVDSETGQQVVRFRKVGDKPIRTPLRFGLMAGDVIHNLRSALDHVVYQLAIAGGGTGARSQFPLFEDADEYGLQEARFLDGVVDGQRAIIEGLQPYHVLAAFSAGTPPVSERDPLAANVHLMNLGRLDNIDKHRLLLPSEFMVPFRQPRFTGVAKAEGTHSGDWYRVQDGAEYFRITRIELLPGRSMADVQVNADHPYTIGFGDPVWGPMGQPNDFWSDRAKGFATKADLALTTDVVEHVVGMFNAYFGAAP